MNEQSLLPSRKDRAPRVNDEDAKMRRLATVVLDSNDAITILDFDGRINAWNRGAELMYGYSENEALRMTIWQLAPLDKTAEQKEFNRRIFAGEKVSSFETQRQTKDGGILDVWITVTKLVDDSGKVIGIASTERDITERKKKEANLRRLATVLRDSNDAITIQDFEGKILAWNHGAELMYGYSENEALRMTIWQLSPPDKTAEQKEFNRRIFAGEKVSSFETQRQTKDGGILDVWITVTKLVDDSGKVIGIASTERDITERKKEEANLRRLATVLRDSNDAITIQDFEGKILSWNYGAELMYGYSEQEALQKNIWLLTPPNRVKEQKDFTHRLIAGEKITSLETQRVTKDGRILDVWLTLTKVMDDAGKPIGIASTERDITERKWTEEKLHQYTMQLEQKSRDLEQIIYVTSHDLRSPLVNAQGFAKELTKSIMELMEAVNTGDISAEAMRKMAPILKNDIPESLEYIQSSIARMDMQLSALLKLSRLGRAALTMENLDMNKTIAEVVKSLEYVAQEKEARITVDELPPCKADSAQTNQIFLNLIENALKYLDPKRPGKIQIRGSKQGSDIVYCIEDNGIGITRECQEKIFEIFYRVENSTHPGEGLGLTIVRQSAEKQNGAVWVESEQGIGSRFFVKLPGI